MKQEETEKDQDYIALIGCLVWIIVAVVLSAVILAGVAMMAYYVIKFLWGL